jgi:hypothetical protein
VSNRYRFPIVILWTIAVTLVLSNNAMASIGPSAGMEFIGYAMSLIALVGVAFFSVIMWPFYTFMRWVRGTKATTVSGTATEIPSATETTPTSPPSGPSVDGPGTPSAPSTP